MRLSTKTLCSLLVMTAVASAVPGISKVGRRRQESKFDRLLQRHDRKGELRAEVLGLSPLEFREMQKKLSFADIARRRGFTGERTFRLALLGKLKNELRQRGWSSRRIERYVVARSARVD